MFSVLGARASGGDSGCSVVDDDMVVMEESSASDVEPEPGEWARMRAEM